MWTTNPSLRFSLLIQKRWYHIFGQLVSLLLLLWELPCHLLIFWWLSQCRVDVRMSLKQVVHRQAYLGNGWIGIVADAECCDHCGQDACADACLTDEVGYAVSDSRVLLFGYGVRQLWILYFAYVGQVVCPLDDKVNLGGRHWLSTSPWVVFRMNTVDA